MSLGKILFLVKKAMGKGAESEKRALYVQWGKKRAAQYQDRKCPKASTPVYMHSVPRAENLMADSKMKNDDDATAKE